MLAIRIEWILDILFAFSIIQIAQKFTLSSLNTIARKCYEPIQFWHLYILYDACFTAFLHTTIQPRNFNSHYLIFCSWNLFSKKYVEQLLTRLISHRCQYARKFYFENVYLWLELDETNHMRLDNIILASIFTNLDVNPTQKRT